MNEKQTSLSSNGENRRRIIREELIRQLGGEFSRRRAARRWTMGALAMFGIASVSVWGYVHLRGSTSGRLDKIVARPAGEDRDLKTTITQDANDQGHGIAPIQPLDDPPSDQRDASGGISSQFASSILSDDELQEWLDKAGNPYFLIKTEKGLVAVPIK